MSDSTQQLLTIEEASKLLSVKISRLRTAVFKREIPFVKIGHLVRFRASDLDAWVSKKTVKEEEKSWLW